MEVSWLNKYVKGDFRKWIPGFIRSAGRSVLLKTGLVDKRAMTFGLEEVCSDDKFVCS